MAACPVVIVNNDDLFATVLQRLLTWADYPASIVHMHDADPVIRRVRPQLIIVDMQRTFPEEGWMLLRALRALREDAITAIIPVLVISSDAHHLRAQATRLQYEGFETLELPFTPDEILAKVRAIILPAPQD